VTELSSGPEKLCPPALPSRSSTEKNKAVIKVSSRPNLPDNPRNKYVSLAPLVSPGKSIRSQTCRVVRQTLAAFDRVQLALLIALTMVQAPT
jgi:hypothetical protein